MTDPNQNRHDYPPSVVPGIPRLGRCPSGWKRTTFGAILEVVERPITLHNDQRYQLVNAKRNRGGIVSRGYLLGRDIKTQGQYQVRKCDFLMANRQIIHGGCGIVPMSLDGAIVSGEYTVLRPRDDLHLKWFEYFTHTQYFQQTCFHSSIGVDIEKMVLKLAWWLMHELDIPPLPEQQHTADILFTWDNAIEATRALISTKKKQQSAFAHDLLLGRRRLSRFDSPLQRVRIDQVAQVNPTFQFIHSDSNRVQFLRMEDVGENGTIVSFRDREMDGKRGGYTPFRSGDTLVAKITPCFENGKGCLVPPMRIPNGLGSTEFHVIHPSEHVLPEILFYTTQDETFRRRGEACMVGSAGQKRVPAEFIASYALSLPSLPEQRAIAEVLQTADAEIIALESKQAALEKQKKGLMQKLLTGQVRVGI